MVVFDIITLHSPGNMYCLLQKPQFFSLCVILKNMEA